MIVNIEDSTGTVIGTLEFPDGTSSDVINAQLAMYAAVPVANNLPLISQTSARYLVQASYQGFPILGSYLQFATGIPSSSAPFIVPESAIIRSCSVSAAQAGVATYDVQVNGVMVFQIILSQSASQVQNNLSFPLNVGDAISIYCSSATLTTAVLNPTINILIENSGN